MCFVGTRMLFVVSAYLWVTYYIKPFSGKCRIVDCKLNIVKNWAIWAILIQMGAKYCEIEQWEKPSHAFL